MLDHSDSCLELQCNIYISMLKPTLDSFPQNPSVWGVHVHMVIKTQKTKPGLVKIGTLVYGHVIIKCVGRNISGRDESLCTSG